MTTTTELHKEIRYDRATKDYTMRYEGQFIGFAPTNSQAETILNDYVYELLTHGGCETAAALDGGQDDDPTPPVDDGEGDNWGGFRSERVIPNDGLHLTQYTVVTSQPGETFSYDLKILCDDCRAKTAGASKMGEVINGFCDACGIGPSASHFRLVAIAALDTPNYVPGCTCTTSDFDPVCAACIAVAQADMADDVPTENPDVDSTPETAGPSPLRRPRCACGAIATIWDEAHYCSAHYLELPAPQMFCPSCLCVAEQAGDGWRCASCGSVARLDDLLTLSQLIARRESLAHIKVLVFARLACRNCGGPHRIQACPEIAQALLAAEATPVEYDTLEMVRLWSMSRALLVAKLARLTRPQLLAQAVAFAAWLETRTHAGLKAASVLHIWEQMIEVDNGPAAPAMRVAA